VNKPGKPDAVYHIPAEFHLNYKLIILKVTGYPGPIKNSIRPHERYLTF
jgi:hypothetical protein